MVRMVVLVEPCPVTNPMEFIGIIGPLPFFAVFIKTFLGFLKKL